MQGGGQLHPQEKEAKPVVWDAQQRTGGPGAPGLGGADLGVMPLEEED